MKNKKNFSQWRFTACNRKLFIKFNMSSHAVENSIYKNKFNKSNCINFSSKNHGQKCITHKMLVKYDRRKLYKCNLLFTLENWNDSQIWNIRNLKCLLQILSNCLWFFDLIACVESYDLRGARDFEEARSSKTYMELLELSTEQVVGWLMVAGVKSWNLRSTN